MSTAGGNLMPPGSTFEWIDEVGSTQDEAKLRLPLPAGVSTLAVAAGTQTAGRGTRGRSWIGAPGNVFLTVAIPISLVAIPITLVPLRVGVVVAKAVRSHLDEGGAAATAMHLKWPNDVLVGRRKVSGVLIESDGDHLIVGVGVNVRHAPEVPSQGPQRGRPSTCLAEHGGAAGDGDVKRLAAAIARGIASWCASERSDTAEALRAEWSSLVDWDMPLRLRDEGTDVRPLRLESDGSLRVANPDGTEQTLVAEYLF